MEPILEAINLTKRFGGLVAVSDVSLKVETGEIKAIIGPNGAGKTTIFNAITGVDPPTAGEIRFKGQKLNGLKPYEIASQGISRTFQNVELFDNMSVLENVMVGRHPRTFSGLLSAVFHLPKAIAEEKAIRDDAMERLAFVGLSSSTQELASKLPFGQQRVLELARAWATDPELLLLDEPAAGLNSHEATVLADLILKIREKGTTILLVEHDMELVMDISDEIIVLNYGKKIAEGKPEEIQDNQEVIKAYLGEDFKGR